MAESVIAAAAPAPRGRLEGCLEALKAAAAQPERFLSVQDGLAADLSSLTKTLYDFHKALGPETVPGSPLKELVVDNFDEEQIWQQLELQNNAILSYFEAAVARSAAEEDLSLLPEQEEEEEEEEDCLSEDNEQETDNEVQTEDLRVNPEEGGNSREEKRSQLRARTDSEFNDDDSDVDFDIDKLERQTQPLKPAVKRTGKASIVDDRFFKLAEMEVALDAAEKKEGREDDGDGDEDEDIDYFEDVLSEDDDEEDVEFGEARMKPPKSARDLKYRDYFDPVDDPKDFTGDRRDEDDGDQSEGGESEAEEEDDEGADDTMEEMDDTQEPLGNERKKEASKKVTFAVPFDSDAEDEPDASEGKMSHSPEMKSSFEKRQEKMSEKIKSLEEELLKEKSWQLRGEVTAQKRPENSLLEETLLFDHAVKMAPVITEETTMELEEIIKRRIKDQAWDDVVRKEKPKEDPYEYKKRLTLDHEKSKLSLAEIYEQEYLKLNQKKTEEEEKPEHIEIQKMMDALFLKLDALSNFHFTPKPPVPEVKIVSNLPAIAMEEVAPVSVSDAALLAPEEIKEKTKGGDLKTDGEKTSTDKKRERRTKKLLKRVKLKEKEKRQKLLEKAAEQNPQLKKGVSAGQLKKLKAGGASLLKDDGKDRALKSSRAFFSQLQDQVKMQIRDAKKSQRETKKRELSAQKLKL